MLKVRVHMHMDLEVDSLDDVKETVERVLNTELSDVDDGGLFVESTDVLEEDTDEEDEL